MTEQELLEKAVPESIKEAISSYETYKVASLISGLKDFSFETVSQYLGTKLASRKGSWRSINRGLQALKSLGK